MSIENIAAHLRNCEEALIDPEVRRDRERGKALLSADFVEFGSSGRVWSRDAILDLMQQEDYAPVELEDFRCVVLSETVALVTYSASGNGPEGRTNTLRSSIWTMEDGIWKMRFHQGTRAV